MGLKGLVMGIIVCLLCLVLISIAPELFPDISRNIIDLFDITMIVCGFGTLFLGLMARD